MVQTISPKFATKLLSMALFRSLIFVLVLAILSSWGFLAHRTINQLAIYELPNSIQPFFYRYMDSLVKHSVRPDLRRNEDSTEDAKHYINFEFFGDSAAWKMPVNWDEAVKKYTKDSLLKHGYVSYHVIRMKDNLSRAFRNSDRDSIIFYAADLAHYIGDANVPLHSTMNYDGQLTNQRGLHSLWESMIPEIEITNYDLRSKHRASYLKNPEQAIWDVVRESFVMVNEVLQKERDASVGFTDSTKYRVQLRRGREVRSYTSEFAKEYNKRLGNSINKRLIQSANLVADFWYTAWVDAGKPDLNKLLQPAMSKEEKEKCKQELKAFKKNRLLQKDLLIAKKAQTNQ